MISFLYRPFCWGAVLGKHKFDASSKFDTSCHILKNWLSMLPLQGPSKNPGQEPHNMISKPGTLHLEVWQSTLFGPDVSFNSQHCTVNQHKRLAENSGAFRWLLPFVARRRWGTRSFGPLTQGWIGGWSLQIRSVYCWQRWRINLHLLVSTCFYYPLVN